MHTGWLLIICSDCCLHLNPVWSELSPRSSPNPQSSAAWLQRFPLCRFFLLLLLCGGFRHLVCRTTMNAWDWLILPQVFGKHGEKGMPAAPRPARGAPALGAVGSGPRPQLRGCRSQPRAGGDGLGAFPSPYQDSWVSTVDTLLPGLTWKLPLQKPQI